MAYRQRRRYPCGTVPAAAQRPAVSLEILGQHILVEYGSPRVRDIIAANFGAMSAHSDGELTDLHYRVELEGEAFSVSRQDQPSESGSGLDDLVYWLDKDLTIELQRKRKDLFFLHAAAVEWRGNAYLLTGESGDGKSTTTWALLHHGFGYLSDELSPIDLRAMQVCAYPHALCVKQQPPPPYGLPPEAMHLGRTIHVPANVLPGPVITEPRPLGGIFVIRYSPDASAPDMRRISAAEGAARMYVTALNALAHADAGLAPVLQIAEQVPCFALSAAGLPETCALIRAAIE